MPFKPVSGVEVPYQTHPVANSLVVQFIVVPVDVVLVDVRPEMIGAVTSGVPGGVVVAVEVAL